METATSGGALGRGPRGGGTASRGGRGLHGGASGSGPPSSPPPPPPPASPAGARGCRAGRPAASNAHTSPGERRVGQTTGGCGEPPPAGGSGFQHRGRGPGPGTKWRATPARKTAPSSGLPEQLHPIGGPVGGLGQAEGVGSCWEPPRLGQGPPRDRCLGQDHRLQPGGRPPRGDPGLPSPGRTPRSWSA